MGTIQRKMAINWRQNGKKNDQKKWRQYGNKMAKKSQKNCHQNGEKMAIKWR